MNLKEKPFYLDDTDVEWVNKTLESLTDDEKIGQLFLPIGYSVLPCKPIPLSLLYVGLGIREKMLNLPSLSWRKEAV